jgi:hypothetical protein
MSESDTIDRRNMLQVAAESQFNCDHARNLIVSKGDKIIFSGVWFAYDKPNLRLLESYDFDRTEWVDWK